MEDVIVQWKQLLIALLNTRCLDPRLVKYIGDPLNEAEAKTAVLIAKRRGYDVDLDQIGLLFVRLTPASPADRSGASLVGCITAMSTINHSLRVSWIR